MYIFVKFVADKQRNISTFEYLYQFNLMVIITIYLHDKYLH